MRGYTAPPMQPKPSRAELDQIAEHYELGSEGVDAMLEVAEARPDAETTRQFLAGMLRIGGVLSLAAGPVLGAFLVGVLSRRTGSRGMLTGMIAGTAVLVWVWSTGATAWTWYAFIGASVTALVAIAASPILDRR